MPVPDRRRIVGSVASAFRILEALAKSGDGLMLADIAEICRTPKSSAHRMLRSLVHMGYVEQEQSSRYRLTFRLLAMGIEMVSSVDIVRASRPHLESLVRATNENAYLAVPDQAGNSIYVARVETSRAVRVQSPLGAPNPSWAPATGRAILAFRPDLQRKVLSGRLRAILPTTVTDPDLLRANLAEIERSGFAVTSAQVSAETCGIAAPIRDFSGSVIASCGIAAPLHRMNADMVRKCIPLVVRAATGISVEMGMTGSHKARSD